MEEKIKYKKCPYCDLNYIATTDYCCKVCYSNSEAVRKEVLSQRNNAYKIKENQSLSQQETQEYDSRKKLLALWESFDFIGFLHTTNFDNFVNIYKSGFLKSRNQLISEGFVFEDNAESTVLEKTLEVIKSKVRFYYRPITPTNISAYILHKQLDPVLIVFDKSLIFEKDIMFCNGCAGSNMTAITNIAKEALRFNWEAIFSKGPFISSDLVLKNRRNAEFLADSPISLDKAIKFYFKNYKDYSKACEMLGEDSRFEHNPSMFY